MTDYSDDQATGIYQTITDCLLVGDYVDVKGVCLGKEVLVELLTDASPPTEDSNVPLRIHMLIGGPVIVSSSTSSKQEEQEKFVQMGIQKDKPFNLCILATEDAFKITLNNEHVCTHKYLVDLETVQAIGVDGEALFTDIEFKDIFSEEGYETPRQETPVGFIRMQELRESSMRKKGAPVYISATSPRQPSSPPDLTHGLPAGLDKQISNEWKNAPLYTPGNVDMAMSRSDSSVYQSQVIPENENTTARSSKSSKGIGFFQGRRKSATLDHTPEPYYVGAPSSKVVGGDIHPGTYQLLDDEEATSRYRPDSRYTSTSSTQDRKPKGRSWFGSKSKKSKSSDSDIFSGEDSQRESKYKRNSIFGKVKKGSSTPPQSAQSFESLNTLSRESMDTDVTLRNPSSGRGVGNSLYLGVATEKDPIRGTLPKGIAGGTAAEMASYITAQRALSEFENYKLIPVRMEPAVDPRQTRSSRPNSTQYINQMPEQPTTPKIIPTSYVPRDSYNPRESMPKTDRQISIPRDIKGTAPEMAAIIDPHYKYTARPFDNSRMIPEIDTDRMPRTPVFQEPVRVLPRQISTPEKVRTIPTKIYHEPDNTTPRSTTIYQPPARTLPVRTTPKYYTQDPPATAATLYDRHHNERAIAISDGSLADVVKYQPMQPREVIFQKPKIDIDLRSPSPVRIPEPFESHRIYSMPDIAVVEHVNTSVMSKPTYDIQRRNSIASVEGVDTGFYLVAGSSPYYHERARSVKAHRSSRSLRREHGNRTRSVSGGSSVSSFRVGDIAEFRTERNRKSGHDSRDISSWLKYQPEDENIHPASAGYRMQYAAPIATELSTRRLRQRKTNMILPATVSFPEYENSVNHQCVELHTMLTADSKTATLALTTDGGEVSHIILDFAQDCIVFRNGGEANGGTMLVSNIPYVPEQVTLIRVDVSHGKEGVLRFYLNDEEMCAANPAGTPYKTVVVRGDLTLLSVRFE